jgi:hypothetical protein
LITLVFIFNVALRLTVRRLQGNQPDQA